VRTAVVPHYPTVARPGSSRWPFSVPLDQIADEFGPAYRVAEPFPNVVLDNLFRSEMLDAVLDEWPSRSDVDWNIYDDGAYERGKLTSSDLERFGPTTNQILTELNSAYFLEFLGRLTGIAGLISDPYFASAGLFEVLDDGFLSIHGDFNINQRTGLDRRCNVLVYLNHGWTDEEGGQLEFWRAKPYQRERSIVPVFNRTVIFDTKPNAYHGHPNPVVSRTGVTRKAISAYYFTRGRPIREALYGVQGNRTPRQAPSRRAQARAVGRALTPPILVEAATQLRRKVTTPRQGARSASLLKIARWPTRRPTNSN
jgi:Rps23 Pro-64 3,4-dihydroxylase Tpa1-like proline 4-hydroxylase